MAHSLSDTLPRPFTTKQPVSNLYRVYDIKQSRCQSLQHTFRSVAAAYAHESVSNLY